MSLKKSFFLQARESALSENDVIENLDSHDPPRLAETPRQGQIFPRGSGVTRGMIMKQDEARRLKSHRLSKDFAGMHQATIEAPARDHLEPLQAVASIQDEQTELLHWLGSESRQEVFPHLARSSEDGTRLRGLGEHPPSQLEGGHQPRGTSRLQSSQSCQTVGRRLSQSRQPAGGRENLVGQLQGGKTSRPCSQNHRQELVGPQHVRPPSQQLLPGTILRRQSPVSHLKRRRRERRARGEARPMDRGELRRPVDSMASVPCSLR